jgi:manganese/zinc/iron transport system permease protein
MSELFALLQSHTVQTVALGAAILGVISGVLGSFAVMRRQSLLSDALSHAALPGVCLGFMVAGTRDLGAIMAGAFLTCGLAALAVLLIIRRTRIKTDAALGVVLSVFFAVGVVLLTVVQGQGAAQAGLEGFLFGQAAAILRADLMLMGGVMLAALLLVLGLWKELKLVTFDPEFARVIGLPVLALEVVLTVMVALAIVVGLQLVGVVLMVAMLIAPAAAARQWVTRFETMVILAALFGVAAGVGGAVISAVGPGLSTGPVVVLIASAIALLSLLLAPGRGLLWQGWQSWTHRRDLAEQKVLLTLHGLSRAHADPDYPAEKGMIDALHGVSSKTALAQLEARGLARAVTHPPELTPHWELTPEGHATARRALRSDLRREEDPE